MANQFSREIKISGGIIILAFVIFFGAFFWLRYDIGVRANDDAILNGAIKSRSQAIGAFAQNKQDAAVAAAYQRAISALIPPRDNILSFPQWLNAKAKIWKIGTNFSFSGSEVLPQGGRAGYINFALTMNGNINDITGFLNDLETKSTEYLIAIDASDIQKTGDGYSAAGQGRVFFK